MEKVLVGVIGGSGLYEIEALSALKEVSVSTPFGKPSDPLMVGTLSGVRVAFLSRHGKGHRFSPTTINYRANLFAMKKLGVERILSVSAVGSMKEEIAPGEVVVPDQFYDHTKHRVSTFFGQGIVVHIPYSDPVCPEVASTLAQAARVEGVNVHEGGTYLCMEGPQFSSRAESLIYRKFGVDVIGMTNATEAKLAREAEICYATLALATDYDCWHSGEEAVTADAVLKILRQNVELSKRVISQAIVKLPQRRGCGCGEVLKYSIMTQREKIPRKTRQDLGPIIGKYLKKTK
jgi:5'-methylthioadenosine phosphorylase